MASRQARRGGSPHVELARMAIEAWVNEGRRLSPREMETRTRELAERSAAFVCLKKGGRLRGCMGTIEPARSNLAEEIAANAVSAASRDPRFPPLEAAELSSLEISVDVLGEPEAVESVSQLDPRRYGVIVRSGTRVGLLLPDLEGVDTVERQLEIARDKAGIGPREEVRLFRFTVDRYR